MTLHDLVSVDKSDVEKMLGVYDSAEVDSLKNQYGNVDCSSGVPKGTVWIMSNWARKTLVELGIKHVSAFHGFRKHGRNFSPILRGVVIARGDLSRFLDAAYLRATKKKRSYTLELNLGLGGMFVEISSQE